MARPLKRMVQRQRARAGILMYHRIADERFDPWNLCVSPAHFDEQMDILARHSAGTDLASLARRSGFSQDGSRVAVTFDDGYIDNFTHALPVLERYDIPATIFVVTGMIGRQREFWWDALTRAFFEGRMADPLLELHLPTGARRFWLEENGAEGVPDAGWRPDEMDAQTPRQQLFLDLWEVLVLLDPVAQDDAIDQILAWADCPSMPQSGRLPATADIIVTLARHPLVSIGSHTQDHASLTGISSFAQRAQIDQGHRQLEQLIGERIDRFSYPFGRYDDSTLSHIRGLGVDIACTSHVSTATPAMDPHLLPRLQVTDMGGAAFARWLRDDHGLLVGGGRP